MKRGFKVPHMRGLQGVPQAEQKFATLGFRVENMKM